MFQTIFVTDKRTGKPIEGARVNITPPSLFWKRRTNKKGEVKVIAPLIPLISYEVSTPGYKPATGFIPQLWPDPLAALLGEGADIEMEPE